MTRAAISQLAGVSRSFTYENDEARAIVAAAQTRSQPRAEGSIATITAQQEASWRERALNAEDRSRELSREIATQRRLVSDLTGQLREPDGTWIEHDRDRLRHENQTLLLERNQLVRERAELHRKLDGARANVSRLSEQRVTRLSQRPRTDQTMTPDEMAAFRPVRQRPLCARDGCVSKRATRFGGIVAACFRPKGDISRGLQTRADASPIS